MLDASHFARIVSKHHNEVFSDAFTDALRTFKEMRHLAALRNEWAHVQEISFARARQAADLMKHILASLRCEEALEVERMSEGFAVKPGTEMLETHMEDLATDDGALDLQFSTAGPSKLWHQLRCYLAVEPSVEPPEDQSSGQVRVTVKAHNTAPDSRDWPIVHFRSVVVRPIGGSPKELGELSPGDTREVEFSFPAKQLVCTEFEISGEIDADKFFQFTRTTGLPEEIVVPLHREFLERLGALEVNEFVEGILEEVGAVDPGMTLADIARVRGALGQQSERVEGKRAALGRLFDEFSLTRESTLGSRTREIILALVELEEKLAALDEAIGRTDIDLMNEAVRDLRQIQLAVLRVEGTVGGRGSR